MEEEDIYEDIIEDSHSEIKSYASDDNKESISIYRKL